MAYLFYHMKVKNVIIDFLLVIQIIGFQNESCILEPIIFCITNEISFRIISVFLDLAANSLFSGALTYSTGWNEESCAVKA